MTAVAQRPDSPVAPPPPAPRGRAHTAYRTYVPAWWRDLVGVLTWASMLVVLALWVGGGNLRDLTGWGTGLTAVGRLTGLVASDLLLIQVLLMARIPLVERTYGQDELARRHRLVGFWSFNLMWAHVVVVTLGYAVQAHINVFAETWDLVVDYRGILLAVAGALLLVLVTVSSIRKARRRLRYESWHLLHLYAYLGVGLALPHQLWAGQEFMSSTVASIYWWTLWGAAAGAVLVWRLGVPLYRTLTHQLRVVDVVRESHEAISVVMTGWHLDWLPVAAGQFFVWRFLDGPGWTRGHPYSLSAAPTGSTLRITVKDLPGSAVGPGDPSRGLATIRPGTRVAIEGPYGRLHDDVRTRRKVLLLAGGIGVTPLRGLLEALPQQAGDVTMVYRSSHEDDLILKPEIEALAAERGARVFYAVGPRVADRHSWLPEAAASLSDEDALRQLVPDIADHDVYLCGADGWMDAAERAVLAAGVPRDAVHLERFSW
ncbi:MAG: ferredoxin reductase family protein [Lapillicoccus sp.]